MLSYPLALLSVGSTRKIEDRGRKKTVTECMMNVTNPFDDSLLGVEVRKLAEKKGAHFLKAF